MELGPISQLLDTEGSNLEDGMHALSHDDCTGIRYAVL